MTIVSVRNEGQHDVYGVLMNQWSKPVIITVWVDVDSGDAIIDQCVNYQYLTTYERNLLLDILNFSSNQI